MIEEDKAIQDVEVDFKYLLKLGMTKKVSWNKLKGFLDDLASTFETSKKLNDILLEEIQTLHSRTVVGKTQEITNETQARENQEETISDETDNDDDVMAVPFSHQESIDDTNNQIEKDNFVNKRANPDAGGDETLHYQANFVDTDSNEDENATYHITENQEKNDVDSNPNHIKTSQQYGRSDEAKIDQDIRNSQSGNRKEKNDVNEKVFLVNGKKDIHVRLVVNFLLHHIVF